MYSDSDESNSVYNKIRNDELKEELSEKQGKSIAEGIKGASFIAIGAIMLAVPVVGPFIGGALIAYGAGQFLKSLIEGAMATNKKNKLKNGAKNSPKNNQEKNINQPTKEIETSKGLENNQEKQKSQEIKNVYPKETILNSLNDKTKAMDLLRKDEDFKRQALASKEFTKEMRNHEGFLDFAIQKENFQYAKENKGLLNKIINSNIEIPKDIEADFNKLVLQDKDLSKALFSKEKQPEKKVEEPSVVEKPKEPEAKNESKVEKKEAEIKTNSSALETPSNKVQVQAENKDKEVKAEKPKELETKIESETNKEVQKDPKKNDTIEQKSSEEKQPEKKVEEPSVVEKPKEVQKIETNKEPENKVKSLDLPPPPSVPAFSPIMSKEDQKETVEAAERNFQRNQEKKSNEKDSAILKMDTLNEGKSQEPKSINTLESSFTKFKESPSESEISTNSFNTVNSNSELKPKSLTRTERSSNLENNKKSGIAVTLKPKTEEINLNLPIFKSRKWPEKPKLLQDNRDQKRDNVNANFKGNNLSQISTQPLINKKEERINPRFEKGYSNQR